MANISDTVLLGTIDQIGAVTKDQVAAYTSTVDLYDIMVREQNPDDLLNGVDSAEPTDDNLDDGTGLYQQWSSMLSWLTQRSTSAGSTGIDGLVTDRYLRIPKTFDDYIYYQIYGSHMTAANLFTDTEVNFGTFEYGGSFVDGTATFPSTVSYLWGVIQVGTGGIGTPGDWVLEVDVTYADGTTTGSETVTCAAGATAGTRYNIGANSITSLSKAGQTDISMTTTTGMSGGQIVLVWDNTWPSLLAADAVSGQADIQVSVADVGAFSIADAVTVRDDSTNETLTIESINYETGVITMTTNLSNSYTTAADAFVYLTSGSGDGWLEMHTISSVTPSTSITLSNNLRHSYYSGSGIVVRALSDITGISTSSGGHASDDVIAYSKSERTIAQA